MDKRVLLGNVAIWGLAALGAVAGNKLGNRRTTKAAGMLIGTAIGHAIGYKLAPHERQARQKAAHTSLAVITRKSKSAE